MLNLASYNVRSFKGFGIFLDKNVGNYYMNYTKASADGTVVEEKEGIIVLKDSKRIVLWDGEKSHNIRIDFRLKDTEGNNHYKSKVFNNIFTLSNNDEIHTFRFRMYTNDIKIFY